jgi:hypothetical protein
VGDITGVVLAGGAVGAGVVADCVAAVDSVSNRGHNSGGVSIASKGDSVFPGENTGGEEALRKGMDPLLYNQSSNFSGRAKEMRIPRATNLTDSSLRSE